MKMLENKVAIITGAGRGIGKEAALMLARENAKIVVSDVDKDPAEECVKKIISEGGDAVAFVGDVTESNFAEELMDATINSFGKIDIIINNAGFTWDGVIHKMSDKQWDTIIDVHVKAPFRIIRAAAPHYRDAAKKEIIETGKASPRKIINVSSTSGTSGNAGQVNYAAAKAGIVGMTKTIAKEWGRFNVQCNAISYGVIDTRLTLDKEGGEKLLVKGQEIALGVPEAQRNSLTELVPLNRWGSAVEAAAVMLFFASSLSDFITGQILKVDGGLTM